MSGHLLLFGDSTIIENIYPEPLTRIGVKIQSVKARLYNIFEQQAMSN